MSRCSNCEAINLSDSILCNNCRPLFRFTHRADCLCDKCGAQLVEINGLNDVPNVAAVKRQSISRATRIIGNYAFFPDFGWRRYVTLASATWNQYLY
jgi:predicted amidophosphoribosyltransferase